MKIENGYWLFNGKKFAEMNYSERMALAEFIKSHDASQQSKHS